MCQTCQPFPFYYRLSDGYDTVYWLCCSLVLHTLFLCHIANTFSTELVGDDLGIDCSAALVSTSESCVLNSSRS